MWLDILWWATIATSVYLIGVSVYFRFWPHSAPAEAIRFMWCMMTHQRWHVVQKESETLTRLYCTRCGHTHLAPKRPQDRGKPRRIPDDPPPTRKGEPRNAKPPHSQFIGQEG